MITGKDLKEARQRKHLSQEEVAELSGYSVRQISRMENDINIGQLQRNVELLACLELIHIKEQESGNPAGTALKKEGRVL